MNLDIKIIVKLKSGIFLIYIFLVTLFTSTFSFGQFNSNNLFSGDEFKLKLKNRNVSNDTIKSDFKKSSTQKINVGGIFLAPSIGVAFPTGEFSDYSVSALIVGVKAEIAHIKFYPFIFGFVYEYQSSAGNGEYITTNSLTDYNTEVTYIGGSLDIVLSKYIKTDFTTPIFSFELKYASVVNNVEYENSDENYSINNSLLTYSFGLGFTLYVFDLSGKYTFADPYSTLAFQAKFHFPLIKF